MEIKDRVIVVTGGGSGIGRALCERFAADGARAVIVADLNEAHAREVAAAIGDRAQARALNVGVDVPLGDGWLLDREQWRLFGKMREVCAARAEQAAAPPEEESPAGVTVVVDEASRAVQRCAGPLNALLVAGGRDAALRAWLAAENFTADGQQIKRLEAFR